MMNQLKLKVKEKIWETAEACSFYFENLDGKTLFYKPGQYLTFKIELEDTEYFRSFSLHTLAVKNKFPGITIKKKEGGKISNYFLEKVKEGDVLTSYYPAGEFYVETSTANELHYFLIAAGSGIVPLFAIANAILEKESKSKVTLIYANKNEETIIFNAKIIDLILRHADRFSVIHILSKPNGSWQGFIGRLNSNLLKSIIVELKEDNNTRFFLCGPEEFMKMCEDTLLEMGHFNESIKKENFVGENITNDSRNQSSFVSSDSVKMVSVTYKNKEYIIEVPEGKTILEQALLQGIRLPYSCGSGVCTACIGRCMEGQVDVTGSVSLSPSEIKDGYVLTCIGRPISDNVKIVIE